MEKGTLITDLARRVKKKGTVANAAKNWGKQEIIPQDIRQTGYVIEFKSVDKEENETVKTAAAAALEQIEKLGLLYSHTREVTTANGKVERRIFGGAVIIIQGRDIEMQVMENDAAAPPLIGYLILEAMDFVVDPKSQKILPNPAHDGKWIIDLY